MCGLATLALVSACAESSHRSVEPSVAGDGIVEKKQKLIVGDRPWRETVVVETFR